MKGLNRNITHTAKPRLRTAAIWPGVQEVMMGLRAVWPFHATVAVYAFAVWVWLGRVPFQLADLLDVMNTLLFLFTAVALAFLIARLIWYMLVIRPESPLREMARDIRDILGNPARLLSFIILFPTFFLFVRAFSIFKSMIAHTNPFQWDETFMRLDQALHGGVHPWQWLYPYLHSLPATWVVNFLYNAWFLFLMASLFWVMLQRRLDETPIQYLFAFLVSWIVGGSLMAWYFSSAGPVYYNELGFASDPYAPLRAHLERLNEITAIWAVDTQKALWKSYLAQDTSMGGISAFPSMHNAQAALLVMLAWRINRKAGLLMVLYAFAIVVGSIWLGWHYAVDAYAGLLVGVASWFLAAPLTRYLMRRPAMQQFLALQERLDTAARR